MYYHDLKAIADGEALPTMEQFVGHVAGLEGLPIEQFERLMTTRFIERIAKPKFIPLAKLQLPRHSAMHFLPTDNTTLGPSPTHVFLRSITGQVLVDHISALKSRVGDPLLIKSPTPEVLAMQYRKQNPRVRPLRVLATAVKSIDNLIVYNYSFLNMLYRYRVVFNTRVISLNNKLITMVENINELANTVDLHHFIEIELPKVIPTKAQLMFGAQDLTRNRLPFFPDDKSLILLELWKWLGPQRETSVFNRLSEQALARTNLVVIESGYFTVLNLGLINSWLSRPIPDQPGKVTKGVAPIQMLAFFLKFLTAVVDVRTAAENSITVIDDKIKPADNDINIDLSVPDTDTPTDDPKPDADNDDDYSVNIAGDVILLQNLANEAKLSVNDSIIVDPQPEPTVAVEPPPEGDTDPMVAAVVDRVDRLLNSGSITQAEHRKYIRLAENYKHIKDPITGKLVVDVIAEGLTKETVMPKATMVDIPMVLNKSMLNHSVDAMDNFYNENLRYPDIYNVILAQQQAGVIIHDINVVTEEDAYNAFDVFTVKLQVVPGEPSKAVFKIPKVDNKGEFLAGGVKYRLKRQKSEMPIRKTKPHEVSISSYIGKLFVRRSLKRVDDYVEWLKREIRRGIYNKEVTKVEYRNTFSRNKKGPRIVTGLSQVYATFVHTATPDITWMFDYDMFKDVADIQTSLTEKGESLIGKRGDDYLACTVTGTVYVAKTGDVIGSFEELVGIASNKAPVDKITIELGGAIPVGFVLGYHKGINWLLQVLKPQHRFVDRGARMELQPDEYPITFADKSLILNRNDQLASLIIGSINQYHSTIKLYNYDEFNYQDVYGAVLTQVRGMDARTVRKFDRLLSFLDPITVGSLKRMGEPEDIIRLLIRAGELLLTNDHPSSTAGKYRRIKGYERFAGAVAKGLDRAVQDALAKPISAKNRVLLNPNDIWLDIRSDGAVSVVEQNGPIHRLKESELVTYAGNGGRSGRVINMEGRGFDPEDVGVISEAGIDSGDVGVITYMVPEPKLANIRGEPPAQWEYPENETASILSTTSNLLTEADRDDPKRAVFAGIQLSHYLGCKGYQIEPYLTGYEAAIGQRVNQDMSDFYTYTAKEDGEIVGVKPTFTKIKYVSGKTATIKTGRLYGVSTGHQIAHDMLCDLPVGHKFKAGAVIAFNQNYFRRHPVAADQVLWMSGRLARVILVNGLAVLEDSSVMSADFAQHLETPHIEQRVITVRSNSVLTNLVQVGQTVTPDTVLAIIQDAELATAGGFDNQSNETLARLGANSPRAKYDGVVNRIEVVYNDILDDMHPSLMDVVMQYDELRAKEAALSGSKVTTGKVADLEFGTTQIKIWIDNTNRMVDGNKVVISNQLKTVIKEVIPESPVLEDGSKADLIFGAESVDKRQVISCGVKGMCNTLVVLSNKRALKSVRG